MRSIDTNTIEMMSALAEPTRIRILECIGRDGELCAKDILPLFTITQPTLSHHLNLLLEKEILVSRKDGRNIYYSINKESMESLKSLIDSLLAPPVMYSVANKTSVVPDTTRKPNLKKRSSVPKPKIVISSPDLEEIKKNKKKKSKKDKKDKKKKK